LFSKREFPEKRTVNKSERIESFTFFGLILLFKAYISLLYFPVSILLYYIMTVAEEKGLVKEYGEHYREYQKKVRKRIIPFIL
jgi:protein-S-isoprenylcysteine O-methyltransferase Ste14